MPSKLDIMVMEERLSVIPSDAPAHLVAPGQAWISAAVRCYKCVHFDSNKPHTGTCFLQIREGLLTSHDMMPGDGCQTHYLPKWVAE